MNNVIELRQLWDIIRKHFFAIAFMAIIGAAIGYGVARFIITPTYSASTSMLVNRSTDNTQAAANLSDQQADVQIINTYKNLVISSNVMGDVSKSLRNPNSSDQKKYDLTIDQLKKMVSISNEQSSQVFSINVKSDDPREAARVANTVSDSFKRKISDFMKVNNVSIIDVAKIPKQPVGPNKKLYTLISTVIFISIISLILLVKELSDTAVRSPEDVSDLLEITNLGTIGYIKPAYYVDIVSSKKEKKSRSRLNRNTKRQ